MFKSYFTRKWLNNRLYVHWVLFFLVGFDLDWIGLDLIGFGFGLDLSWGWAAV